MRDLAFRFSLVVLGTFLLAGCASQPEVAFVPSENIEEIVIPQIETNSESELPEPFSGKLTVYGESPILHEGLDDSWDSSFVFPGAVLYQDGLYHMFYNGIKLSGNSGEGGVGYAISANGTDWYRVADAPIFTWDETVGDEMWLRASSALIEDDGTWVLYLSSLPLGITEELPMIWRATAPAPNGPWTFDDIPLLEPGESSEWDYYGVLFPIVLKTEDRYLMYYLNARFDNRRGISGIGLATSDDGLFWTKYNNPATEERFSESDPIFVYEGEIAGFNSIQDFFIWQDTQGFAMFYGIGRNNPENMDYATSSDGIIWTSASEEPIFSTEEINFMSAFGSPKVLVRDGEYLVYLYSSAESNRPVGDIYLIRSE
jgi:hypothetical protein